MTGRLTPDRLTAIVCLVIAVLLIIALPSQTSDAPLPGVRGFEVLDGAFFPKVAITLFVIASVWLFFEARPKPPSDEPADADPLARTAPPGMRLRDTLGAAAITAGLIGYVLVVEYFGYVATTIFGVCVLAFICGQRSWVGFVIGGVVLPVVIYYLFSGLFFVPLPRGTLWFG